MINDLCESGRRFLLRSGFSQFGRARGKGSIVSSTRERARLFTNGVSVPFGGVKEEAGEVRGRSVGR